MFRLRSAALVMVLGAFAFLGAHVGSVQLRSAPAGAAVAKKAPSTAALARELAALKRRLARADGDITDLSVQLAVLDSSVRSLGGRVTDLNNEVNGYVSNGRFVDGLTENVSALKDSIAGLRNTVKSMCAEIDFNETYQIHSCPK